MSIPIRNLYYLFCYAWDRFPEGDAVEVGVEDSPELPDLFGRLLVNTINRLLRRGLYRDYRPIVASTRAPRGKLLVDEILKTQSLRRGEVICRFDELTPDVLHNQILKATTLSLATVKTLNSELAHALRLAAERMGEVSPVRLTSDGFRRVQLSRASAQYSAAIRLCELIHHALMPDEVGAGARFADILQDEVQMSSVFESFLRNFYRVEQSHFRQVGAEAMSWDGESLDMGGLAYLPSMVTDITLRSPDQIIVADAKYYAEAFVSWRGPPKIHSANLYQMLAYVQHAGLDYPGTPVSGVLIYPAKGESKRLRYRLRGYQIEVATIDFMQPWQGIRHDLLALLDGPETAITAAGDIWIT